MYMRLFADVFNLRQLYARPLLLGVDFNQAGQRNPVQLRRIPHANVGASPCLIRLASVLPCQGCNASWVPAAVGTLLVLFPFDVRTADVYRGYVRKPLLHGVAALGFVRDADDRVPGKVTRDKNTKLDTVVSVRDLPVCFMQRAIALMCKVQTVPVVLGIFLPFGDIFVRGIFQCHAPCEVITVGRQFSQSTGSISFKICKKWYGSCFQSGMSAVGLRVAP